MISRQYVCSIGEDEQYYQNSYLLPFPLLHTTVVVPSPNGNLYQKKREIQRQSVLILQQVVTFEPCDFSTLLFRHLRMLLPGVRTAKGYQWLVSRFRVGNPALDPGNPDCQHIKFIEHNNLLPKVVTPNGSCAREPLKLKGSKMEQKIRTRIKCENHHETKG